jgi:hypothetical protein
MSATQGAWECRHGVDGRDYCEDCFCGPAPARTYLSNVDLSGDVPLSEQQRAALDALPRGSITLNGFWIGECVCLVEDYGTDRERVVVVRADDAVLATAEMVEAWRADANAGPSPHLRLDGHLVSFGTADEGLGVVTYEIMEPHPLFEPPEPRTHYLLVRREASYQGAPCAVCRRSAGGDA